MLRCFFVECSLTEVVMFCGSCGEKLPPNAKFCCFCGVSVSLTPSSASTSQSIAKGPTRTAQSFEEYRERKKTERVTRFTSTAKKPRASKESDTPVPVTIQIGLINLRDGELKIKRGSNLPVKVSPEINMESLKSKAVQKHSQFNSRLEKNDKLYYLLYPDKTIVEKIPGTDNEVFTLKGYKEAIGKSYSRLTLYICTITEFLEAMIVSSDEGDKLDILDNTNTPGRGHKGTSTVTCTVDFGCSDQRAAESEHYPTSSPKQSSSNRDSGSYDLYCDLLSYEDWYDSDDDVLPSFPMKQSINALETNESTDSHPTSVKDILQTFKVVVSDIEDTQTLRVRRRHVWTDCIRAFSKPDFVASKLLHVHFIGEEAADMGGPRRELLRLLMQDLISTSGVFTGDKKRKTFTGNPLLLMKQVYFHAGQMVMTSLTQGGPGLKCLSPAVFAYICGSSDKCRSLLEVQDVSEPDCQDKVIEIQSFPDESFKEDIRKHTQFLFDMGLTKPTWSAEEKPMLLKMLYEHLVINSNKAAMDQFIQGFESVNKDLYKCIMKNEKIFEPIFCYTNEKLTPENVREVFQYSFSVEGANAREGEELTSLWFEQCLDGKDIPLPNLLVFITGADEIPPQGFSKKIEIKFFTQRQGERRLPHSSTCSLELYLPRGVQSYNEFKEMLRQSLFDTCGFGNI